MEEPAEALGERLSVADQADLARGPNTTLWGQVRPGKGRQSFRLRFNAGAGWRWVPGTHTTTGRGYFTKRVRLPRGARVQVVARGLLAYSLGLTLTETADPPRRRLTLR